jgi:hypothetical protein
MKSLMGKLEAHFMGFFFMSISEIIGGSNEKSI